MANEKNLIPLNKRSKEDAKKIQRKGAFALHKKQKEKKTYQTLVLQLLDMKLPNKIDKIFIKKRIKDLFPELKDDDMTNRMAQIFITFQESLKGNLSAVAMIKDFAGENNNLEVNNKNVVSFEFREITNKD